MGQKVNPIGFRVGINRVWDSRWYAGRQYGDFLHEDIRLRRFIEEKLQQAGVSRVVIERSARRVRVVVHAARPGVIIGKKGNDIEKLRTSLSKMAKSEVSFNIVDVRKPEIDAGLVAENIARQLERRVTYRRAMKRSIQAAMRIGAKGIRINIGGRLGGAEIARMEWQREGRVPLHTLRAMIDYGTCVARTTYGTCGVKVWIYKGEAASGEMDMLSGDDGSPSSGSSSSPSPSSLSGQAKSPSADAPSFPESGPTDKQPVNT